MRSFRLALLSNFGGGTVSLILAQRARPGVSSYARDVIPILRAVAVLLAAFIKRAVGFGFPALGTPLLSLLMEMKTALLVLILPNIVMDAVQFAQRGAPLRRSGGSACSSSSGPQAPCRHVAAGSAVITDRHSGPPRPLRPLRRAQRDGARAPRAGPVGALALTRGRAGGWRGRRAHQCAGDTARALLPRPHPSPSRSSSPRWPLPSRSTSWSSWAPSPGTGCCPGAGRAIRGFDSSRSGGVLAGSGVQDQLAQRPFNRDASRAYW
jgi:hypothetical protein